MSIEPDYTVEDGLDTVTIKCNFQGRTANQCNLTVADLYAKFNLHPYFLVVDFPKLVSTENVLATASKNTLTVRIKKLESEQWPPQNTWKPKDKELLAKQRDQSMQRLIDAQRAKDEAEKNQKEEDKKAARQRAWDLDKAARETLKEAKNEERNRADEIIAGESSEAYQDLMSKPLYTQQEVAPPRRKPVVTTCAHTPTLKGVPARYDGPQRNFLYHKKDEKSPYWLKEQGDTFYKNKDYKSAINAYTEAINISDRQFVAAFSNRALTYLQMGLYKLALSDCEEALKQFHDPIVTPELAQMKVRLLSRRTAALVAQQRYLEAFSCCGEITKYIRNNPQIKADLTHIAQASDKKMHMVGKPSESEEKKDSNDQSNQTEEQSAVSNE